MKHKRITGALAAATLAAIAGGTAACSSSPGTITGHGTMTVNYGTGIGLLGGTAGSDPYSDGTQVVVVDSHGTVVASTALTAVKAGRVMLGGMFIEDSYTFTVTVPGGLPRYGIQVGGTNHGTIWETPAEMTHPALTLDLT